MRVGITGATGFTGGHTLRALIDAGHTPRALVRNTDKLAKVQELHGLPDIDHVVGDVTDAAAVAEMIEGCDSVIHTAAIAFIGRAHEQLIEQTNVPATRIVLEHAVAAGLDPIVHVSSQSTLHPPAGAVYRSTSALSSTPLGVYAKSKVESERIARDLQDQGHPVVIVWPSGITGPDDVGLSVLAEATARLLQSNTLPLPKTGGNLMIDVRDLARLLVTCIEPGRGPRRYGAFGHFVPWSEIPEFLTQVTGRTLKVRTLPNAFFHGLGWLGDLLGRVNVNFPLDRASARFMTELVAGDDSDSRTDLDLEWRPAEETYRDMLRWMVAQGHLSAEKAPAVA